MQGEGTQYFRKAILGGIIALLAAITVTKVRCESKKRIKMTKKLKHHCEDEATKSLTDLAS